MWKSTLFCLCTVVCAVWAEADVRESKLVHIVQGPVRGYKDPNTGIYFFQGIPYASIPTGPNRFKAALPPPTWIHPLEAVSKGTICPQPAFPMPGSSKYNEEENCLIASVYVPDSEDRGLPVVVFVHGGGFQIGSGDALIPSVFVAENNIIAVTFNYRLGTHGFLCLGTEDIPGNAGMKDQVTALRWVQKNIAGFGGNPNDVTILGHSAGSAAVDLLMLSKLTEGLFNKVIAGSGASTAQWAIQSDPLENAKEFAKTLNFTDVDNIHSLEFFYKTASLELLNSAPSFVSPDSTFGHSPCIERDIGQEIFLDKSAVDILKSKNYRKLPLLYGFANMDGLLRIGLFDTWKHKMNEKFSVFLPANMKFKSVEEKEMIGNKVKHFYFGDEPVEEHNIISYVDYYTDVIIAYPMLRAVHYHVEAGHNQIYLYDYSFVDDNTPYVPHTKLKGANHSALPLALFTSPVVNNSDSIKPTEEFIHMSLIIRKIWGNFVKTAKPIPEGSSLPQWPPVGKNWSPHMSLGTEIILKGSLLENRVRFWDDVYSKYYRDPIPPPKNDMTFINVSLIQN